MKIELQARRLWEAIEPGNVEPHDDCMALDALTNAVPAEMVSSILGKASARDVWDSIKTAWISDERIRMTAAQKARRE